MLPFAQMVGPLGRGHQKLIEFHRRRQEAAFRAEVRSWIDENFPASLKGKPNPMMREERDKPPSPEHETWRKAMGEKGWGVPTWPKQYAAPTPHCSAPSSATTCCSAASSPGPTPRTSPPA